MIARRVASLRSSRDSDSSDRDDRRDRDRPDLLDRSARELVLLSTSMSVQPFTPASNIGVQARLKSQAGAVTFTVRVPVICLVKRLLAA